MISRRILTAIVNHIITDTLLCSITKMSLLLSPSLWRCLLLIQPLRISSQWLLSPPSSYHSSCNSINSMSRPLTLICMCSFFILAPMKKDGRKENTNIARIRLRGAQRRHRNSTLLNVIKPYNIISSTVPQLVEIAGVLHLRSKVSSSFNTITTQSRVKWEV